MGICLVDSFMKVLRRSRSRRVFRPLMMFCMSLNSCSTTSGTAMKDVYLRKEVGLLYIDVDDSPLLKLDF